ncbi:glycoside hydrolase family 3 C-terminal domain-containing protein [Streptomyces sioyaensis]|uniref:beta-N-acetylhexosaminidase n=1 Tax=Streptomyces sioyaensis TaxID=67364 RepID=A0A4Q1RAF9_9ACTN|nr:glycoside hydrolase family 3 protein [Streptomyces sioyaensis]MBM4791358.1 glycoside hydrolase family 3 C-terminal domain-containing protein [Streptomyces sioyaensis]RXS70388.1 glycoside hydrolase family 3 protein [Streptomyces sioyaensis]
MHSRRTVLTTAAAAAAAAAAGAAPAHAAASPQGHQPSSPATRARLRRLISRMTPEEKVGQLFVMRVYGHSATDPDPADVAANQKEIGVANAAELIAKYHVGGIIYFGWAHNTREPHQIADLSNGIQKAAAAQRVPVPLLISTDQEHGIVARVGAPATLFPGAMALGAGRSRDDARTAGRIAGEELFAMGIRQDYAPDADVNVNPANPVIGVRSFGADPQAVARMVAAEVTGYQRAGVAACAKHFPGHGDTDTDSHVGLPYIHHTAEEWERLDAPPFKAAIAAGIDSIMTAHIVVPAFDKSEDPATLSRPILTGILRERLGYDGVVVTDSLGMEGVRVKYGDARVPVLALKAGVDQLLNPPDLSVAHAAVLKALADGELSERDLDAKLMRILLLKDRRGLFTNPYTTHRAVDRAVGTRSHLATADRIADRTTTLLRNDAGILPLSRRRERRVLVVGFDAAAPSGTGGPPTTVLAKTFTELGFTATALSTGLSPGRQQIDEAVAALTARDAVVVATYNVTADSPQRKLVAALLATGKPVVQLAVRNPYDIAQLAGVKAALASYSWTDVELRAAARVIAGRRNPAGRLPVPIMRADTPTTALYRIGHGLSY